MNVMPNTCVYLYTLLTSDTYMHSTNTMIVRRLPLQICFVSQCVECYEYFVCFVCVDPGHKLLLCIYCIEQQ